MTVVEVWQILPNYLSKQKMEKMSKDAKEASRIVRQCRLDSIKNTQKFTLEDLVATQLTEEMMEKFKIGKRKRETLRMFQSEHCNNTKIKEYRKRLTPLYKEIPRFNDTRMILRERTDECPTTKMSAFQELAIKKRV